MTDFSRRIANLERDRYCINGDPRMDWLKWPGPDRVIVLALVDFVAESPRSFWLEEGPSNAPGFDALHADARQVLSDIWELWGSSRRFARIVASIVNWDIEFVLPLWAIQALITRAKMRRRFPSLLARFARDGDPTYSSHRTYRAENWPERTTWSDDERSYLSKRFFDWDQRERARQGLPSVAGGIA